MQVVVLAGGLGTRIRGALPEGLPKAMAPVGDRPFLEFLLSLATNAGATEFLLLTGYGAPYIRAHFGTSYVNTPIRYCVESVPRGTAGALKHAEHLLAPEFILMNGDTYFPVDFVQMMEVLTGAFAVMALTPVPDTSRYGRVSVDGSVVVAIDEDESSSKQGLINAGSYALLRDVVAAAPKSARGFERDLLQPIIHQGAVRAVFPRGRFLDIGIPEDYARAFSVIHGAVEGGI